MITIDDEDKFISATIKRIGIENLESYLNEIGFNLTEYVDDYIKYTRWDDSWELSDFDYNILQLCINRMIETDNIKDILYVCQFCDIKDWITESQTEKLNAGIKNNINDPDIIEKILDSKLVFNKKINLNDINMIDVPCQYFYTSNNSYDIRDFANILNNDDICKLLILYAKSNRWYKFTNGRDSEEYAIFFNNFKDFEEEFLHYSSSYYKNDLSFYEEICGNIKLPETIVNRYFDDNKRLKDFDEKAQLLRDIGVLI